MMIILSPYDSLKGDRIKVDHSMVYLVTGIWPLSTGPETQPIENSKVENKK